VAIRKNRRSGKKISESQKGGGGSPTGVGRILLSVLRTS
jgi:hypothetical protein